MLEEVRSFEETVRRAVDLRDRPLDGQAVGFELVDQGAVGEEVEPPVVVCEEAGVDAQVRTEALTL